MDMKKNILKAVGLREPLPTKAEANEILGVYNEKIQGVVVDAAGSIVEGKTPEEIGDSEKLHPLYIYKEGDEVVAYCFPIVGKGLWSTLYGYFALEPDAKTVRGISFYEHGETPGLGAEIEKDWFLENFEGKKIWNDEANRLQPVEVVKGKVSDKYSGEKADYYVDGISGATMTSKGVTEMVDREIRKYESYFKKIRS